MGQYLSAIISGIDFYVPERIVTNNDMTKMMDTSDEWIQERTGIKERRFASIEQGTSDLAIKASIKLLKKLDVDPTEIDLILAATLSPDHFFPGIGVQIQDGIGAKNTPALDIRGQCSGFSWSLSAADAYIRSGMYKKVLVVGAEIHSRLMDMTTRGRNMGVLFGDGAGAALVEAKETSELPSVENKLSGLIDHTMGSDGSGLNQLAMIRPGLGKNTKTFADHEEIEDEPFAPQMEGRAVFKHAVSRMLESAQILLKRSNIKASDIDIVVPHQANMRISETIRHKLSLPPEKFYNSIERYGNTTAATLPIGLSEAEQLGKIKRGDLVLTVAFGSGYTWGGNLFRF